MPRIGGSTVVKRSKIPRFWPVSRKRFAFGPKVMPGPHAKSSSYPLLVLIRDDLKLARNAREVEEALDEGSVLVDGVVRKDVRFPVGLMDVIEIPRINGVYRLLPNDGTLLKPVAIPKEEKGLKICKVVSKTTVRGGGTQYGLHDGRSILSEADLRVGRDDSFLIKIPSQEVSNTVPLAKGSLALATAGRNAGSLGVIVEVKPGTFTRSKEASVQFNSEATILPASMLIAVGEGKTPLIRLR